MNNKDYYSILEITQDASHEEIKKAYKKLIFTYHPDKLHNDPLQNLAEEKIKEINKAFEILGNSENRKDYDRKHYKRNKQEKLILFQKAMELFENRQFEKAKEGFEEFLTLDPDKGDAHFFLGLCHLNQKNFDSARISLEKAVKINPLNHEALNLSGICYFRGKDYSQALYYHRKASELAPSEALYLENIAHVLWKQKKTEEALDYFKRAMKEDPDKLEIYVYICYIYNEMKQFEKVKEYLRKAKKQDRHHPMVKELEKEILSEKKKNKVPLIHHVSRLAHVSHLKVYSKKFSSFLFYILWYILWSGPLSIFSYLIKTLNRCGSVLYRAFIFSRKQVIWTWNKTGEFSLKGIIFTGSLLYRYFIALKKCILWAVNKSFICVLKGLMFTGYVISESFIFIREILFLIWNKGMVKAGNLLTVFFSHIGAKGKTYSVKIARLPAKINSFKPPLSLPKWNSMRKTAFSMAISGILLFSILLLNNLIKQKEIKGFILKEIQLPSIAEKQKIKKANRKYKQNKKEQIIAMSYSFGITRNNYKISKNTRENKRITRDKDYSTQATHNKKENMVDTIYKSHTGKNESKKIAQNNKTVQKTDNTDNTYSKAIANTNYEDIKLDNKDEKYEDTRL